MTYALLDSGDFEKLEQIGEIRIVRPAAQAIWKKTLPATEWEKWQAKFERFSDGTGEWKRRGAIADSWVVEIGGLKLKLKLTSFGHLGVFGEQLDNWHRLRSACHGLAKKLPKPPVVLNLFGYTGGSSIACAQGGAHLVHLDSSKGTVDWAHQNFDLNGLETAPVRYMVDDAVEFVEREVRRGNIYDGVILDPPTYGRGTKKQMWKIETGLVPLLESVRRILNPTAGFVLLSCHSPGYSPVSLNHLLAQLFEVKATKVSANEMLIVDQNGHPLPSGVSAWFQYGV
jgi:23S rRNA (cytosine1962-C5)-methyltransferase